MSDLMPEDEALLERARGGLGDASPHQARVKGKLFAQLGIGLGTTAIAAKGGASAAAVGVGSFTTIAKVMVALAVVGGVVGTGVVVSSRSRPVIAPTARSSVASEVPLPLPLLAVPPRPPEDREPSGAGDVRAVAPSPPTSDVHDAPPVPASPAVRPPHASHAAAAPLAPVPPLVPWGTPPNPAAVTPSGPTTVAAEAELLRRADAAAKAGDPGGALALVDEHAARFPAGILVEERQAERIVVLCALGRVNDARAVAAVFLRDRPRSPLAGRVRASCAVP